MSKSSKRWLQEHQSDEYVQRAKKEGWRSRAVYKLMELDQKYALVKPGLNVVDLGAAPGGWSQYVADRQKGRGRVFALDLLEMPQIDGVEFLQGDFREEVFLNQILTRLEGEPIGLVLSDMAPNISGMKAVDAPRAMYLADLALEFSNQVLVTGGSLVVKLFQGEGFDSFLRQVRERFVQVNVRKPKASRPRSNEVYLVARNYRM